MPQNKAIELLQQHQVALDRLLSQQFDDLDSFAQRLAGAFNEGHRLLVAGSGLLAPVGNIITSMFQHRLHLERPPLPAFPLGTDPALAQALCRDNLQEDLLTRQFATIGRDRDILLLLVDGTSDPGMTKLAQQAKNSGCFCCLFQPNNRPWDGPEIDITITIEGESGGQLAATSLFCGQLLCALVEHALFGF